MAASLSMNCAGNIEAQAAKKKKKPTNKKPTFWVKSDKT